MNHIVNMAQCYQTLNMVKSQSAADGSIPDNCEPAHVWQKEQLMIH